MRNDSLTSQFGWPICPSYTSFAMTSLADSLSLLRTFNLFHYTKLARLSSAGISTRRARTTLRQINAKNM